MSAPILITGVGKRVGLYLARTFLERGVPVIGTFRTERQTLESLRKAGADLYSCDFNDDAQIARLTSAVLSKYEHLRSIVHNASDWVSESSGLEPAVMLQRMMQVHVSAPYQINLALASLLREDEGHPADIIHVGDYVGSRGSKKHIAYAASKAAQDNLTLSFAARLAPSVKVNSIAPALLLFNEGDDDGYREKALGKSLMRREGGLDEFQRAVD